MTILYPEMVRSGFLVYGGKRGSMSREQLQRLEALPHSVDHLSTTFLVAPYLATGAVQNDSREAWRLNQNLGRTCKDSDCLANSRTEFIFGDQLTGTGGKNRKGPEPQAPDFPSPAPS